MSSFVVVCRSEDGSKEDCIELPTEDDGSLLLSVLQSQFEGASGLKYRNPDSGSWRAIKLTDGQLKAPSTTGWDKLTYYVVMGNTETPVSGDYLNDGTKRIKLEEQSQQATPDSDLIVLGLEWTVTTDDMKSYFEQFGEITSAEVKTNPASGESRGFGFIRFKDPEVYQRVCELSHTIKGRKVDVKLPKSRPAKFAEQFIAPVGTRHLIQPKLPFMYGGGPMQQRAIPGDDLIVLGLEWKVTTEDLKSYFEKFGEVTSAEVKTDPTSGASRGFGFIRFKDPDVYQRVCELNHAIKGRKVEVKLPNSHPAKIFVGCLPLKPPVQKEELETHFSEFGTLTDVYVPHEPYRGFGFITFRDPAVAQRVMSMQHTLRKSQLNLSLADPKGGGAKQQPAAYTSQGYNVYQHQHQQQYSQLYSQYAQQQGLPRATAAAAAYGYNPYGTSQAQASYNKGFMDSRAQLQYSQVQQSMLAQNSAQTNPAYTHQAQSQQQYTQQRDPNPLGSQATTVTSFPAGAQLPDTAGRVRTPQGHNLKGVWSNY